MKGSSTSPAAEPNAAPAILGAAFDVNAFATTLGAPILVAAPATFANPFAAKPLPAVAPNKPPTTCPTTSSTCCGFTISATTSPTGLYEDLIAP